MCVKYCKKWFSRQQREGGALGNWYTAVDGQVQHILFPFSYSLINIIMCTTISFHIWFISSVIRAKMLITTRYDNRFGKLLQNCNNAWFSNSLYISREIMTCIICWVKIPFQRYLSGENKMKIWKIRNLGVFIKIIGPLSIWWACAKVFWSYQQALRVSCILRGSIWGCEALQPMVSYMVTCRIRSVACRPLLYICMKLPHIFTCCLMWFITSL